MMMVDYAPAEECQDDENYGTVCYKCGKCGRKFNEYGIMVDDGGTTVAKEDDD